MRDDFENLEDIFGDISGLEKTNEPVKVVAEPKRESTLNMDLVNYYAERPGLLEGDIENGIIPPETAADLRNAVYAYPKIEQENPPFIGVDNVQSKGKQKVKTTKDILHESYDLGFAETLLLGLVVSSIGLAYLGYLYLVI